jgi:hypothetical protein
MSQLEDLQAAKEELTRKLKLLRNANKREDELRDSSPPPPEEILAKAKLGVAEAELGVAKAKLSVAEAELDAAKTRTDTPDRAIAEAKEKVDKTERVVDKAEMVVDKAERELAKAEWEGAKARNEDEKDIEVKRSAYEKTLAGHLSHVHFSPVLVCTVWLNLNILNHLVSLLTQLIVIMNTQARLLCMHDGLMHIFLSMHTKDSCC